MSTGVAQGQLYKFRLKSENAHGFSTEWSDLGSIYADDKPDKVSMVTTTVESQTYVRIEWTEPYDGSSAITHYEVLIKEKDGDYSTDSASCDGSDPSLTHCDVPMQTLRAEPFNLEQGDIVVAIVRAVNANGEGAYSEPNSVGVEIEVEPAQMEAPVRGSGTTETQIELSWTTIEGLSTGGASIDSYNLKWD